MQTYTETVELAVVEAFDNEAETLREAGVEMGTLKTADKVRDAVLANAPYYAETYSVSLTDFIAQVR